MHEHFDRADKLSREVIGAAMEVHSIKGPGLIESIYEKCLMHELVLKGIEAKNQVPVKVEYKGMVFEETLRLDLLVGNCLITELKVVDRILPVHEAQLLSYMKLMNCPVGLIINFGALRLKDGIRRMTLKGAPGETQHIS
jgi:GxxExxY protein